MLLLEKLSTNSLSEKAGNIKVLWWRSNLGNLGRSFVLPIAVPCIFGISEQQIYIANLLTIFAVQKLSALGIKGFQEMPITLLVFRGGTTIGFTAFRRIKNG